VLGFVLRRLHIAFRWVGWPGAGGAAAGGHEAVVALLLECGADASRRDTRGRSAAAYARAAGHPHLAERLDTVVDVEKTMR
jgi:hypothetical protein